MNLLDKAHSYEKTHKDISPELRPVFHFTAPIGWTNDPNGFSTYHGEYHLFFQYYPYDVIWGDMHWGHAKTKDFIKWEYLPAALAPEDEYDSAGCFSGSAIELEDGRQMLIYTGVTPNNYNPKGYVSDKPDGYQNQCIAIGDGINYIKYSNNPVLLASTAPEGGSLIDFRDPKVWKENDLYYMLLSNRPADGSGDILLYQSKDALHWDFVSIFASNQNRYGKMWECPDYFSLDDNEVLLVSPMEMQAEGLEFHAGHGTIAFLGSLDKESHVFQEKTLQAIDYGIEFYSTQTLKSYDGRRIMIAWMQNWATKDMKNDHLPFFGQMTIPRELHVKNERLIQNPVKELESYRSHPTSYQNIVIRNQKRDEYISLEQIRGRILDMTLTLTPLELDSFRKFEVQLAQNDYYYFSIQYLPEDQIIHVDRSHCGSRADVVMHRDFYVRDRQGALKLRILMDKYSVELFVNDGEQAATFLCYSPLDADGIRFHANGTVHLDLEKYDLKF